MFNFLFKRKLPDPNKFKVRVVPVWYSSKYMAVEYYDGVSWKSVLDISTFGGFNCDRAEATSYTVKTNLKENYDYLKSDFPSLKRVLDHNEDIYRRIREYNNKKDKEDSAYQNAAKSKVIQ